jgi:hypothetical protein
MQDGDTRSDGTFADDERPVARDKRGVADFGVPPISVLMPRSRARGLPPEGDCVASVTLVARLRTRIG